MVLRPSRERYEFKLEVLKQQDHVLFFLQKYRSLRKHCYLAINFSPDFAFWESVCHNTRSFLRSYTIVIEFHGDVRMMISLFFLACRVKFQTYESHDQHQFVRFPCRFLSIRMFCCFIKKIRITRTASVCVMVARWNSTEKNSHKSTSHKSKVDGVYEETI